ncbi:unnamed protein product [Brassica napus]|uniref:(rape) hypothetical protein n=1 Tax=Brassica napus TaxID=3708 RepID=A0A816J4S5_BRANA|nr:unnamed protein product [Brassica napus]
MIQYSNCADPTESAARKERCRLAEEHGEFEQSAINLALSNLNKKALLPHLPRIPDPQH